MKNDTIEFGVVGVGGRGHYYAHMISQSPGAHVKAVADPNPVRAQRSAASLPTPPAIYPSVAAMLDAEQLDAVVVTAPDFCHEEIAVTALEHGVNLLSDKPLAATTAGCVRIVRLARDRRLFAAVGFNLRHAPVLQAAHALVMAGEIGDVMMIENREFYNGGRTYMARWNRQRRWSGGLWIHKGTHDFDVLNWLNPRGRPVRVCSFSGLNALRPDRIPFPVAPDRPVGPNCGKCAYVEVCPDKRVETSELFDESAVRADGYYRDLCIYASEKDTHDNGMAMVEFDNNVRGSHFECFICNFDDRQYSIIGDRGTLLVALSRPLQVELHPRWGETRLVDVPPPPEGGHGGADPRLLADFISGLRTGQHTQASLRDGLTAVAVGEAAEISWREHRLVEIKELVDLSDPTLGP